MISAQIIYRYYIRGFGDNFHDTIECNDKFSTLPQLKKYFTLYPGAGYLVGYGKKKPEVNWALRALLVLEWTDDAGTHMQEFNHVNDFVIFLKSNQALATMVQYPL